MIRRSGEHLRSLIEDLLDVTRIESGVLHLEERPFDLAGLCEEIITLAQAKAESRGLGLESSITVSSVYRGDDRRLRQVLSNLLENSLKYTPSGWVKLTVRDDTGEAPTPVWLMVDDSGDGIPASKISQALDPFEQVHDETLTREGVGLGLALCQRLVAMMGGELVVQSRVTGCAWGSVPTGLAPPDDRPHGTRVSFRLALPREVSEAPAETRTPLDYQGQRRRILVVDDNPVNRKVMSSLLTRVGFQVAEAVGFDDCLGWLETATADLLIIDLVMPGRDGLDLIKELRGRPSMAPVPIIAASATVLADTRQRCLEAGANGFLDKPVEAVRLYRLLGELLALRWIYHKLSPSPAHGDDHLEIPPAAMLYPLLDLLEQGDVAALVALASQDLTHYPGFLEHLLGLAREFRLAELEAWLLSLIA